MKKINAGNFLIPKIIRYLPLQEYDPGNPVLAGGGIHVWVNPPGSMLVDFDNFSSAYSQAVEMKVAFLGRLKSQKTDRAHIPQALVRLIEKWVMDIRFKRASEICRRKVLAWYSVILSQSPDVETRITMDQLQKINDLDPSFYGWICLNSRGLIEQHIIDTRKEISLAAIRSAHAPKIVLPIAGGDIISRLGEKGLIIEWFNESLLLTRQSEKAKKALLN